MSVTHPSIGSDEVFGGQGSSRSLAGREGGIQARSAGFWADLWSVALRSLRALPREPEVLIPSLIIPIFFFAVNIGSLQAFAERGIPGLDFRAFQLPTAIVFAVTGVSRANALVTDIQSGYFDRLLMTPIRRLALLLGLMAADFIQIIALSVPVIALGMAVGVRFETGLIGLLLFLLMSGFWGLAFTGFPYAIALKTASAGAVGASFILFFPFAFLTTGTLPLEALTGWLQTVARFNPMTYLLAALRSLLYGGWQPTLLLQGAVAILLVGVVSIGLALAALRGRVARG
ncbi:MAG: ABC transporter protein [uncultured Thermomicrobiales bacterium]|uniref:Transport permease protein n=1 Tax=uncultured Thermomicrobiales bacterium TaxID=1645740 RepID=A0A6J4URA0_9BACT|nr:MAG: ABC transporter protein [uncultured Thermomicrobiales bacterium]